MTKTARTSESQRLADRGIDPGLVIGHFEYGGSITVAGFYGFLSLLGGSEKAGQDPTYALARLALVSGLPNEVADTLFLAYNQQSAEEAGHGDKVFGNAYFSMGGVAPDPARTVFSPGVPGFLVPTDDPSANARNLTRAAAALGGIETGALHRVFPFVLELCQTWKHPIAAGLARQIEETVRPEESRHVLIWRYVFHTLVAPAGPRAVAEYCSATNDGRRLLGLASLSQPEAQRLLGTSTPTPRQLLGRELALV